MENYMVVDGGQEEILERIPIVVKQDGQIVAQFESIVDHKTFAGTAKKYLLRNPKVPSAMRDDPDNCQLVFHDEEKNVKAFLIEDDEHMLKYAVRLAFTASLEIITKGTPI